jgi:hypothetical protein
MKAFARMFVCVVVVGVLSVLVSACGTAEGAKRQSKLSKEVIKEEDGVERHWLVKSDGLIVEEHGLTIHGNLHLMVQYPKGVRGPQIDSPNRDTNAESVATMFYRSGTRMSRPPMVGEEPNGKDFLWWPNGKLFREARFVMGTPTGVWKYYDKEGRLVGKGRFRHGKPQSGLFVGSDRSGYFFFFTSYPIKQQKYENGVLSQETDFFELKQPLGGG